MTDCDLSFPCLTLSAPLSTSEESAKVDYSHHFNQKFAIMLKLLGAETICNFWYLGAERDNKRQSIAVPALSKESLGILMCWNVIRA